LLLFTSVGPGEKKRRLQIITIYLCWCLTLTTWLHSIFHVESMNADLDRLFGICEHLESFSEVLDDARTCAECFFCVWCNHV